ncbi:hypothetical protein G7046_g6053 [Stylonectria norvegica]|nr:hypothetical protein G7046_g6053 [Stylonectria norvegica]
MASPIPKPGREGTTPFLLKLFYRDGTFHRPEEFASQFPPPHVSVYTWPDCTLNELALELAASDPSALPSPAIGTRLAFQLVFPDLRPASTASNANPRFAVKDLGSVIIGGEGPGVEGLVDANLEGRLRSEKDKTLSEARFVVGDYVSCAVLPSLPDGSVAPEPIPQRQSPSNPREGRGGNRGSFQGRENGSGRGGSWGGRGVWRDGPAGGNFPMGDWRRGERVPEGPGGRVRGRGRRD